MIKLGDPSLLNFPIEHTLNCRFSGFETVTFRNVVSFFFFCDQAIPNRGLNYILIHLVSTTCRILLQLILRSLLFRYQTDIMANLYKMLDFSFFFFNSYLEVQNQEKKIWKIVITNEAVQVSEVFLL
ncbi:hypothetical protein XENORESO_005858 [Xenotaenia resolanae]|uniref:Uncharacterized protein n=1 Tax=Xenotaenia resolanae TaxID=208358 RepID=A0ABV0X3Y2_9TELE